MNPSDRRSGSTVSRTGVFGSGVSGGAGSGIPDFALPGRVGSAIVCKAPSKINLWLRVTGRRDDGYHTLDSLVAFASIGDDVTVERAGGASHSTATASGPFAPDLPDDPSDNLVLKAAAQFSRLFPALPVAIHLQKTIPVASGIGGGSADAAAVIRSMAMMAGVGLENLDPTAFIALGADVPMCISSRSSYVAGIGEQVSPAPDLSGIPVVLVNPGIPVATPDVFKARTGPFSQPVVRPPVDRCSGSLDGRAAVLAALPGAGNDLASAAISLCPPISAIIDLMHRQTGVIHAGLSGSGATCFALFDTAGNAVRAASAIKAERPGWWCADGVLL